MKRLPDGDHLLPSGATLTIFGGEPVRLTVSDSVAMDGEAMSEVEEKLVAWFEFVEDDDDSDDEDESAEGLVVYKIRRLEAQPTHRFSGDDQGPRLVRLAEEDISGGSGDGEYHGRFTVALDRDAHEEGEDAMGWPPFLDDGVWRDGWTGMPLPDARVEPLVTEAQA